MLVIQQRLLNAPDRQGLRGCEGRQAVTLIATSASN